jgi:quercetin dioxygenase-like cupin family protein
MLFKKFADAKAYDAPNHYGMKALRLQGFEEGGPTNFWVGLSYILPGGGAGPDTTSPEKVYVVLSGQVTVSAEGQQHVL